MACLQCAHGPKAGFLPLLQLPGQVPCGHHCVSCLLVTTGLPSQDMLLLYWWGQRTVVVTGDETSNEDPREESWGGDSTPGRTLVPLHSADGLPLHSPSLALEPNSWVQMDRALHIGWLLSAFSSAGPGILAVEPWLRCTGGLMKLEVFLPG